MADEIASVQKDGVTITSNSGESQARAALDDSAQKAAQPETETTSEGAAVRQSSPEVSDQTGESETDPQKKPKRRRHSARSRINELTRKNYELERQLAATRQPRPEDAKAPEAKEPVLDDFETYDQYVAARAEWAADKQLEKRENARRDQEQRERFAQQRSKELGDWSERVKAAKEKYPDWDERTEALEGIRLHPALERVLVTSEVGPDVLYHLAAHPEVLEDFRVPLNVAIARLGRLEARFLESSSAPKNEKTKVSTAPEPIRPVGAKGDKTSTVEPDKLPYQEFKRWREKSRKAG